jgi:hypothetical protein
LSAIARECYLGRERWKRRTSAATEKQQDQDRELIESWRSALEQQEYRCQQAEARADALQMQLTQLQNRPVVCFPDDVQVPNQHYGLSMIVLSVNLARALGLRPAVRALEILFSWLGIDRDIPTPSTIRIWMQRVGVDRMAHVPVASDAIWMVDQTNQVGQERVLTVLSINQSQLPEKGTPLRHEDLNVLAVLPKKKWDRESVAKVYRRLAKQFGQPLSILSDGAVELREPVKALQNEGISPLSIRDFKHFAANRLESQLLKDERYLAFAERVAPLRSTLSQTELAHLVPPPVRRKARFMNLQAMLNWASMLLWQADHPDSDGRKGIAPPRFHEKFGWIKQFAPDIARWQACQKIISTGLTLINQQGLCHAITAEFQRQVRGYANEPTTKQLVQQLTDFIQSQEDQLKPGQRFPMSTEILESSFSLYKQLEQQHAKEGFSKLLPSFATLMKPVTPDEILTAFPRTQVKTVNEWLERYLPVTLNERKLNAYKESNTDKSTKRATPLAVTA